MADNRWKEGVFQGNYQRSKGLKANPATPQNCPYLAGWEPLEVRPSGFRVWQLEAHPEIKMRRVEAEEPSDDEWVVFLLNKPWATYSGPVDEITHSIIEEYNKLHPSNNEYQPIIETIPFEGEPMYNEPDDDYGLEARF